MNVHPAVWSTGPTTATFALAWGGSVYMADQGNLRTSSLVCTACMVRAVPRRKLERVRLGREACPAGMRRHGPPPEAPIERGSE